MAKRNAFWRPCSKGPEMSRAGVRGLRWMPRKMLGSAIGVIDWLMNTISVPSVTLKRATHL
jgi:hypothetical protein